MLLATAALTPMPPLFFFAVIIVFVASVTNVTDALCRYVLFVGLLPPLQWHITAGGSYLFKVDTIDALNIGMILCMFVRYRASRGPGWKPRAEDLLVLSMLIPFWIGENRGLPVSEFLRAGVSELLVVLSYFVLRKNLMRAVDFRMVLAALVVSGVILSVYAVYEAKSGWAVFDLMKRQIMMGSMQSHNLMVRGGMLRASTTMSGPLMLACYLTIAFLAAAISRRAFKSELVWLGIMGALVVGVLACQSRGNLVAIVLGLLVLLVAQRRAKIAVFVAVGVGLMGGLAVVAASQSLFASSFIGLNAGETRGGVKYLDYREVLLKRGLEEGAKHRWFGASLKKNLDDMSDIEENGGLIDLVNTYLLIYLVSGIAGLGVILAALLAVIRNLLKSRPKKTEDPSLWAFAVAGLIAVIVQLSFMSYIDRMPMLLMLVLAAARWVSDPASKRVATARPKAAPRPRRQLVMARRPTGTA
ncbi:hypothetical protein [Sphingomonas sp.]|uniref:hypothetical protein n=1 Tax=Sphingomonas sp. TaxID=28214 RepID=UPI001B050D69|nr:hypothetical protein [Sphingomonas sp.]MBO9714532.1 hypothetical protein [Sphingomonas sp.]